MDINVILQKTRKKVAKNDLKISAPFIAIDDRPYDLTVVSQPQIDKKDQKKVGTNWVQTEDKVGTNWVQTEDKVGTNWVQTEDKVGTNWVQSGYKSGYKVGTKVGTKWVLFDQFIGTQKELLHFLYKEIKKTGSTTTQHLTIEYIISLTKLSRDTVKTTIKRLEKKGVLLRENYKNGRGGWSQYSIKEEIFRDIMKYENWVQSGYKSGYKLGTKVGTNWVQNTPISSSSYNIKTTTNSDPVDNFTGDLTEEFEEVSLTPLEHIGLSEMHLAQLQSSGLTSEMIQDSINFFAFDLKNNGIGEKIKTNPLGYFMGILRKGVPYAAPANYEDKKNIALREYFETKKKIEEKRKRIEEEIFQLEFSEWERDLTDKDIEEIIPEKRYRDYPMKEGFLKDHFRKLKNVSAKTHTPHQS